MKNFRRISVTSAFFFVLIFVLSAFIKTANAQVKYHTDDLNVSIKGTTSVQPWELKSDKGQFEAVFGLGKNDKITDIYTLWFTIETELLKSGHAAMENSAYKALKTKSYDNISFIHKSSIINQVDSKHFEIKCNGYLTVAGTEQETNLVVSCKLNDDKTFTCTGSKKLKMTDFNIKPPSVGLGTVKASDEISIAYDLIIGKKS